MRTITKLMYERLRAQAEEAKTLGLTKTASTVSQCLEETPVRETNSSYVYAQQDLENDVHGLLWNAIIRAADFYGVGFDIKEAQEAVSSLSNELLGEVRGLTGVGNGVGAYEPNVPGEGKEIISVEVSDDDRS